jgi:hypothetical protein
MDLPNKDQPNPTSSTAPKKDITPIMGAGTAKPVGRPSTKRFFGFLFAESPRDLGRKIGREIVVPRLKASFEEAANGFLSGMLWGGGNRPASGIVPGTVIHGGTNYRQISTGAASSLDQARQATVHHSTTSSGNYKDVCCPSQQLAEQLLAKMYDLWNQYRLVTVADLYETAGLTPAPSDNSYGWTSIDGARIVKAREGYVLEMPRPVLI